jgi:hypothetical protein
MYEILGVPRLRPLVVARPKTPKAMAYITDRFLPRLGTLKECGITNTVVPPLWTAVGDGYYLEVIWCIGIGWVPLRRPGSGVAEQFSSPKYGWHSWTAYEWKELELPWPPGLRERPVAVEEDEPEDSDDDYYDDPDDDDDDYGDPNEDYYPDDEVGPF